MSISLLPYDPADFEKLYEIDRACYPRGIAYTRRALREFLEHPLADTLVARVEAAGEANAENASQIAGFLIAEARDEAAHIVTIDVVAEHRGSGVGTELLAGMERRLTARGVRMVELETATSNEAGVAFWLRHGYRSCGVLRGYYLGRMDAYLMRKFLDPVPPPAQ